MTRAFRQADGKVAEGTHARLWGELYEAHRPELLRMLRGSWRLSADDAADIAQQAFMRLMAVAEPARIQNPRAYLHQLARNLVVDSQRQARVRAEHAQGEARHEEAAALGSPLTAVLGGEQLHALETLIAKLPSKQRRAFVLNRVYQMSYEEVAVELGISVEGVRKHVLRALEACHAGMRRRFGEQDPT